MYLVHANAHTMTSLQIFEKGYYFISNTTHEAAPMDIHFEEERRRCTSYWKHQGFGHCQRYGKYSS
jgi:hypothetical protein